MTIHLDHSIVPSRNKVAGAKLLADLLGVEWAPTALGPFAPVFVNDGLTLDFIDTDEAFPIYHFCFRVSQSEFDAISAVSKAPAFHFEAPYTAPLTARSTRSSVAAGSTGTSRMGTSGRWLR